MGRPEVFIGVTSWNSRLFIGACVDAARTTTQDLGRRIVVMDNGSTDGTPEIARDRGAEVVTVRLSQAEALNRLAAMSNAPYTLLIHADVVLLSPNWFSLCRAEISAGASLVSPQDIGCGPLSRPFGKNMPESSFLFFDTGALRRLREILWMPGRFFKRPRYTVDFYAPHVTHRLPQKLAARGLSWKPMAVHWSAAAAEPLYFPQDAAAVWTEELAHLRYGLGNFYSLEGEITHYHNWYDRVHALGSEIKCEFPRDYIVATTERFLADHAIGALALPEPVETGRQPRAL